MFSNILVAYDGSDASKRALDAALGTVSDGGKVVVIQCFDDPAWADSPVGGEDLASRSYEYALLLEAVEKRCSKAKEANEEMARSAAAALDKDVEVEAVSTIGPAAYLIAEQAEKSDSDLIVMGRRGLGAVRSMLGSVSMRVAKETDLPLLLVR